MTTFSTRAALADARLQGACRLVGLQRSYFDAREYVRARRETLDLEENRRHKALFVHVPKCAGTTIFQQVPIAHGHRSASFFYWRDRALFESCFTFGIVRNPYDRLVSAFHYLRSDQTSVRDGDWGRKHLSMFEGFEDFMEALKRPLERARLLGWLHFLPQTYYLCDRSNRVLVDYYGRTETFADDIVTINERAGLAIENRQSRAVPRATYRKFYTEETARLVERIYADDFRVFDYPFETGFGPEQGAA